MDLLELLRSSGAASITIGTRELVSAFDGLSMRIERLARESKLELEARQRLAKENEELRDRIYKLECEILVEANK